MAIEIHSITRAWDMLGDIFCLGFCSGLGVSFLSTSVKGVGPSKVNSSACVVGRNVLREENDGEAV